MTHFSHMLDFHKSTIFWIIQVRDGPLEKWRGGWGKTKKKIYSQQKVRKKKIFPGIVPKKKLLPWKKQSCQVSRCTQKGKKAARFVVQIKKVVPISPKNWIILAINISGKFFLTPKMVNWPKIFGDGGGRSPIVIWSKKKNLSSHPVKKKKISSIGVQKKNLLPLTKSPPPFTFLMVRP